MQTPIDKTKPIEEKANPRTLGNITLGLLKGQITVPDDFDDPLPDDLLDAFEGKGKPSYPDGNF